MYKERMGDLSGVGDVVMGIESKLEFCSSIWMKRQVHLLIYLVLYGISLQED